VLILGVSVFSLQLLCNIARKSVKGGAEGLYCLIQVLRGCSRVEPLLGFRACSRVEGLSIVEPLLHMLQRHQCFMCLSVQSSASCFVGVAHHMPHVPHQYSIIALVTSAPRQCAISGISATSANARSQSVCIGGGSTRQPFVEVFSGAVVKHAVFYWPAVLQRR
jgi:hypothetical protein